MVFTRREQSERFYSCTGLFMWDLKDIELDLWDNSKAFFLDICVGSKKGRFRETTGALFPLIRHVVRVRTRNNFNRLVEKFSSKIGDLVSFCIGVVVVHVANTLNHSKF